MTSTPAPPLFPHAAPPALGQAIEVAPGILWVRLALPFRLDHVNIYLVEDGDGFAVIDTGLFDPATTASWEVLLAGVLRDKPVTRIVATHFHPDHVGMAGWLSARTGAALLMSQTEYLTALNIRLDPAGLDAEPYRSFYTGHGLAADITTNLLTKGQDYLRMVSDLPRTFQRLVAAEALQIGRRSFRVLTGGGHAPEQVMLHDASGGLLLCADQVLTRITPNISVQAIDPDGDPLGLFLRSLGELKQAIAPQTLVLPGHDLPFVGLHGRADELAAHHESRCAAIVTACRDNRPERDGFGIARVPASDHRPAPDGLRIRRGSGACELLVAPKAAAGGGTTLPRDRAARLECRTPVGFDVKARPARTPILRTARTREPRSRSPACAECRCHRACRWTNP